MNYRLTGPGIIAPGKEPCKIASMLSDNFSDSRLFSNINDNTMRLCFNSFKKIIIVGALGIATRKIAPYLKTKYSDPAVVVVDTEGKHAISVISGHLGGANLLAQEVARKIDAIPVITTTSDLKGLLTPDYLANKWDLVPEFNYDDGKVLLKINSAILQGEKINWEIDPCLYQKFHKSLKTTPGFKVRKTGTTTSTELDSNLSVVISNQAKLPRHYDLFLRPKNIIAGIGCRRNTSFDNVLSHLDHVLRWANLSKFSLKALASIKHKRCEPGLIEAARYLDLPIYFFEPDQLEEYMEGSKKSNFVNKQIGVGGVCEPAAKMAVKAKNSIIMRKTISNCKKVTTALSRGTWPLLDLGPEENLH